MQVKSKILTAICIVLLVTSIILITLLIVEKKEHNKNVLTVYNDCCKNAQQSLYDYLNTDSNIYYERLCDDIYAMTSIALIAEEGLEISLINNELLIAYTFLVEQPIISVKYLDFLNEALILYNRDSNKEGYLIRLQSFNNRVSQEIHSVGKE